MRLVDHITCKLLQTVWPKSFRLHVVSNVVFCSTVAAFIPSPLRPAFVLVAMSLMIINAAFIQGCCYFASLLAKCGVNLRAATKQGAASI